MTKSQDMPKGFIRDEATSLFCGKTKETLIELLNSDKVKTMSAVIPSRDNRWLITATVDKEGNFKNWIVGTSWSALERSILKGKGKKYKSLLAAIKKLEGKANLDVYGDWSVVSMYEEPPKIVGDKVETRWFCFDFDDTPYVIDPEDGHPVFREKKFTFTKAEFAQVVQTKLGFCDETGGKDKLYLLTPASLYYLGKIVDNGLAARNVRERSFGTACIMADALKEKKNLHVNYREFSPNLNLIANVHMGKIAPFDQAQFIEDAASVLSKYGVEDTYSWFVFHDRTEAYFLVGKDAKYRKLIKVETNELGNRSIKISAAVKNRETLITLKTEKFILSERDLKKVSVDEMVKSVYAAFDVFDRMMEKVEKITIKDNAVVVDAIAAFRSDAGKKKLSEKYLTMDYEGMTASKVLWGIMNAVKMPVKLKDRSVDKISKHKREFLIKMCEIAIGEEEVREAKRLMLPLPDEKVKNINKEEVA